MAFFALSFLKKHLEGKSKNLSKQEQKDQTRFTRMSDPFDRKEICHAKRVLP